MVAFARNTSRDNRADGRANPARGKEYTDSARCVLADGKNPFAKHGEQRQDSAAQPPGGFDQQ